MDMLICHGPIIFLSSSVENVDMNCLTIDGNLPGISVFDGWVMVAFEAVVGKLESEAALAHTSVPEENHIEASTRVSVQSLH